MADEGLTAGAVAKRLGVAVTTLRTWHQRYGLGPSQHVAGRHRRYTGEDLVRIEAMRRLTAQGVSAAEAAAWARQLSPAGASAPPVATARDGGGNTIAVGRAGPAARGLGRAATRLDAQSMRAILQNAIGRNGVIATWDTIVAPVLIGIGNRHAATRRLVEVEHLLSRCVTEVLGAVPRPPAERLPRVLLACADEEQHSLPMEALAAALAEEDVPCRLLGARVPPNALADAVTRTGPAAVIVWSHAPPTADAAQLTQLLTGRRPLLVAAAGPGWRDAGLPSEIPVLGSLADAVRRTLDVVEPSRRTG